MSYVIKESLFQRIYHYRFPQMQSVTWLCIVLGTAVNMTFMAKSFCFMVYHKITYRHLFVVADNVVGMIQSCVYGINCAWLLTIYFCLSYHYAPKSLTTVLVACSLISTACRMDTNFLGGCKSHKILTSHYFVWTMMPLSPDCGSHTLKPTCTIVCKFFTFYFSGCKIFS